MKKNSSYMVFLVISILLIGCQSPSHPKEVANAPFLSYQAASKPFNPLFFQNETIETLSVPAEYFSGVAEWLDDETILYIKEDSMSSEILTFDLLSGDSQLFFKSEFPIRSVTANNQNDLFAIHSSPSFTEGALIVVDTSGEVQAQWSFQNSNDLVFTWNPATGKQLLVSSFKEDWTHENFLLDVTEASIEEKELVNPFTQWVGEDTFGYINWDLDMPSLTAPLFAVDLVTNTTESLMEKVVMFQSYPDMLVTMVKHGEELPEAEYSFLRLPDLEPIQSFRSPLLSMYSNYFVPNFEYVDDSNVFYSFEPESGGSIEGFAGGFHFVSFNLSTGEKETLMSDLENKPIKFSPNGLYFLYGYQLEQLIIVSNKQKIQLVDYS